MSGDLDDITKQFGESAADALRRAFDAGFRAGKREAQAAIRQTLGSILSDDASEPRTTATLKPVTLTATATVEDARATPGSVKPRVMQLVTERPGITNKEIEDATGIKSNSVRGTLWTLTQEKKVERRGKGWHSIEGLFG